MFRKQQREIKQGQPMFLGDHRPLDNSFIFTRLYNHEGNVDGLKLRIVIPPRISSHLSCRPPAIVPAWIHGGWTICQSLEFTKSETPLDASGFLDVLVNQRT